MEFSLTTLGSASAKPSVDRFSSVHVLNARGRLFLLDCCEGAQFQLVRYKFSLMKIDHILISHLHGDHVFGIFGLLSTQTLLGRTADLHIYAPRDFSSMLNFFMGHFGEGVKFSIIHHPLTFNDFRTICETRTVEVSAFPLNHGVETFGFLFQEKEPQFNVHKDAIGQYGLSREEIGTLKRGEDVLRTDGTRILLSDAAYKPFEPRSYAYCSDTAPFPEEAQWLRGTTVIYHETTYLQEMAELGASRHHSTTLQAAALAAEAGAQRLLIGHYSSRTEDIRAYERECRSIFPATFATSDGEVYDI